MNWIINSPWYWFFAFILSACWGVYGCNHEINYGKNGEKIKKDWIEKAGIFLSEFIGSLAGWVCLYILVIRYQTSGITLGGFEAFLGAVAVVGISGYSYKIVEWFDRED